MKFSVNWLGEFVELPARVQELADLLTMAGVEIEGIEKRGANFKNVVVAQITESKQHPDADRLSVCQVDDGSGQPRQIVCGATNYKVGDKVPLALPGAVLPNDLKIRTSKLRGVESQGMLCSEKELGLSEESAGLLILSPEAKVGALIGSLFPEDTILDVEITPNRGDLLSHFGLAREIAALTGRKLGGPTTDGDAIGNRARPEIAISAPHECPFYSARRIENVKVGPAPDWIRARIEAVGVRSVNNIVDITNYVMLELGEPLHAFDAEKLQGNIRVRLAEPGEKFLALDGRTYSLGAKDLMIADQKRAVAIAGVMGGEDTGVTNATRHLLLESAYFLPASVRRTARTLNLPSDASYRFERGVDPGTILRASERASELIREFAGGRPTPEILTGGALPKPPASVALDYERCRELLGVEIESKEVDRILSGFGLTKSKTGAWEIPSHRRDLLRDVDLMEEVVRVSGIDRIPSEDRSRFTPRSEADRAYDFEARIRARLAARGISEARTSALIPRDAITGAGAAVELRNPLSEDHVALRPSLVRGLLELLVRNENMGATSVRLFELGRIFRPPRGEEERTLGLVFSGEAKGRPHWRAAANRQLDFFDLKGAIEILGIPALGFRRAEQPEYALAAEILTDDRVIGLAGQLSAAHAEKVGSGSPILVAEISLESLLQNEKSRRQFSEMEKYPSVTRDIAMLVPENFTHAEILKEIERAQEPLLEAVGLFDLFSGKQAENLGAGRKSLAYTLTYRARNRTLTTEEVSAAHAKIRARLQRELGAELRE